MPLTLEVDPIDPAEWPRVAALAREGGLPAAAFDVPTGNLPADVHMRIHLARALALGPRLLIAEHPSATIARRRSPRLGPICRGWRNRGAWGCWR